MKSVNVLWMYPDLLNLHGERGNAKAFELISKKMKIDLKIDRLDNLNDKIDFDKYDILLFNAGELKVIKSVIEALEKEKEALKKYIESNKVILATGTSLAIFANNIKRIDGTSFNGLNILDIDVNEKEWVIGDDLYFEFNDMKIMSQQIQMIEVDIKENEEFGKIIYGYGNNNTEKEGAKYKNLYLTNALGPVLVKNPWFLEYILCTAMKNKNIQYKNKKIKYDIEQKSLESMQEFIEKKMKKN